MKKIMTTLCVLLLAFTFTCEIYKSNLCNSITASAEFITYRGYSGDATKEEVDFAIKTVDDFIANNITSNMTEMEKAVTACKWITKNYPYSRDYGGGDWVQVINAGGGICWGYSDLVDEVFSRMGIKCNTRIATKDNPTRPSSHSNNAALIDGAFYKVDCSFSGVTLGNIVSNIESLPTYDGWEYTVNQEEKTVTLKQYVGFDTDVVIKPYYDGYKTVKVTGATGYCKGAQIESFTFPDTVEFIGNQVLGGLPNLKTVKFGKGLKVIEGDLFTLGTLSSNNVTELELPEGLEEIGAWAFQGLDKLESVTIPSTVTRVGKEIFADCTSLKNVTFKCTKLQGVDLVVDNVDEISGEYSGGCFLDCTSLESVDLSSLKEYDNDLLRCFFEGCTSLKNVVFPENLTKLPIGIFGKHDLTGNKFLACENITSKSFDWKNINIIGAAAFAGCPFESFVIPNTIESIETGAFEYCKNLKILTLPSSVKSIGTEAFNECRSLIIHVPDSVTDFGDDCFTNVKAVIAQSKDSPVYKYCLSNGLQEIVETEDEFKKTCIIYEYDTAKEMNVPIKIKHSIIEEKIITPATCTEKGLKKKRCYYCNHWFEEDINATGHKYSTNWTVDKAATCNSTGLKSHHCLNCQVKKDVTVIPKSNHSYDNGIVTKKPTCTASGIKSYTCTVCKTTKTETVSATGHDEVILIVSPTCTKQGYTQHTCKKCGYNYKDNYVDCGHKYGQWKVTNATCTSDGKRERICNVCGTKETYRITHIGHIYSSEWSIDKAATCNSSGLKSHHCLNCQAKKDITVITFGEHKFGTWITDKAPTCMEPGTKTKKCSVCGKSETQAIAKTGHTGVIDKAVSATCTTPGKTEGTHCSKCNAVIKAQETIPATGHKYQTTVVSPTYLVEGYTLHKCSACGDSYKDTITAVKKVPVISGAKATGTTYNSIKLSWNKTSGVNGYIVYRYNSARKSWIRLAKISNPNTTSYTATGLSSAAEYQIAVKGYATENGKEIGSPKLSLIKATTNPGVVSNFKASGYTTNSVKLTWNKVNGAEGYIVYRYNPSNKGWIRLTKTKGTSYTATGLASGTSYKFAVKSYITLNGKEFGGSQLTQIFTSTNPDKVNFTVKSPSAGRATFNWSKVRGATGYIVYYKANAKDSWHRLTVTSGTSYTKTGLKRGNNYIFTVKAYKTTGGKVYNGKFINKAVKIK